MKKYIIVLIFTSVFFTGSSLFSQQLENIAEPKIITPLEHVKPLSLNTILLDTFIVDIYNSNKLKYDSSSVEIARKKQELSKFKLTGFPSKEKIQVRSLLGDIHTHIPNFHSVATSAEVGRIAYDAKVDNRGIFSISVPIEMYSDKSLSAPEISLLHNSSLSHGVAGYGWTIGGISEITPINNTIYYDGKTEGIPASPTPTTNYALDGIRLIKTLTASDKYEFLSETGNIRVYGYRIGNAIKYFEVFYPDGSIARYGITSNTYIFQEYPLTYKKDLKGNIINYTYELINNTHRIKKITYGLGGEASVEFNYTSDSNGGSFKYTGGKSMVANYLLQSVTTKFLAETLRTYTLIYSTVAYTSVLSQIQCDSGGKKYNPLIFYRGDNKQTRSLSKDGETQLMRWYNFTDPNQIRTAKGKFEYGSDDDGIILMPNKVPVIEYYKKPGTFNHSKNYLYSGYDGTESIIIAPGLTGDLSWNDFVLKTENGFADIFCANLDQFEEEEVIKVNNYVSGSYDRIDFHVYTPNLYVGMAKKYTRTFNFNTLLDHRGDKSINPKTYHIGDFNGDGKMEVLAVSAANVMGKGMGTKVYIFDLENNKIIYEGSPFSYGLQVPGRISVEDATNQSDKLFVMDYDGDGKTDICLVNDNGMNVYTFTQSGSLYSAKLIKTDPVLKKTEIKDKALLCGEFNGDGKNDFILTPPKNSSSWFIYCSKGDGTFEKKALSITSRVETSKFMLQDVNGDGQTDLVENWGTSTLGIYILMNAKHKSTSTTTITANSIVIPTNIQSRGNFGQLVTVKDGVASRVSYKSNDIASRDLTGIISSFGNVMKIYYTNLNNPNNYGMIYTKGYGAQYPYQNYTGNYRVVANTQTYHNKIKIDDVDYRYQDAIIHKQGLGFLGFSGVYSSNSVTGQYVNRKYDPKKFNIILEAEDNIAKGTYQFNVAIATNKTAKVTLIKSVTNNKLENRNETSTYTYDIYGNPLTETVDYGGGLKSVTTKKFQNINTATKYIIGLDTEVVIATTRDNATSTSKETFTYNANYFPIKILEYFNNNKVTETDITYNTNNNVLTSSEKRYASATALVTKYTYDTYGRILRKTNPDGTYEENTYNSRGQIAKINENGIITDLTYNTWGRITQSKSAKGIIASTQYTWDSSVTNGLYLETTTKTGEPATRKYFDSQNREVRIGCQRFNGSWLYVDRVYNTNGTLQKESLPHKSSPSLWNTYSYDGYRRITALSYASGKKDTYSYNKNVVTSIIDGVSKTETKDPTGQILSLVDPGGTVTYKYRPDGLLLSVLAPGNISTTFEYDGYGRKTAINDPSTGRRTFAYDTSGNIIKETDSRGKVTNFTYNAFNKLIKKELVGELTTTFAYNKAGLIISESSNNNTVKLYTYDSLNRLISEKTSVVDGKWLQKNYTYTNGLITAKAYVSQSGNIVTENYIYANGHHIETKLNNATSVWKLTAENNGGKVTGITTGVLIRTYGYDNWGMPTARVIKNGSTTIQNFTYGFDAKTGNLTWRKDANRNIQENFSYDNLNRLTSFAGKTITYDNKGNITNKSDAGKLEYLVSGKPYAASVVTPYGNNIPQRNQTINFNGLMRPTTVSEANYTANFVYNHQGERVKMQLKKSNVDEVIRYYVGDQYEIDSGTTGVKERLYIGGDAYTASAVYIKENNVWSVNYICRDYLGSITHITNASGTLRQELSYDAWGRLRNPANQALYEVGKEPVLLFGRGYTGHEHLSMFGIINMNARLYDPVVGRFLSADPYIQNPYSSQNFNRYSYCLNNPLKYTDQNGEFLWTILNAIKDLFVNTFVKVWSQGFNAWFDSSNWQSTINAFRLDMGLFQGGVWATISRLTWQLPQTMLGLTVNQGLNFVYQVNEVNYFDGATIVDSKIKTGGMTLGSYILGPPGFKPDFRDHLFVHEYGHYLQSKKLGLAYLFVVAKPSILSATFDGDNHGNRWYETHASKLAADYFDKKYGAGSALYQEYMDADIDPYQQTDIFNRNIFVNGGYPAYSHPRGKKYDKHPTKPKWNGLQDIFFF